MKGIIQLHFGNCATNDKTLRLYNITSEVAMCYCSKTWIMNNRNVQNMEAAKMRFLRPLLGLTILDCQRKSNIHNRSTTDNTVEGSKAHKKDSFDHHLQ